VLFGYYIWLFLLGILRKAPKSLRQDLESYPLVSLIIPTYNEEGFIIRKIENIKSLDYPQDKLQVIFVDGGSEDKTVRIIEENKISYMEILKAPSKGKINQLNSALNQVRGEFVFVTDTDGMMSANTIKEAIREFERDKNIYLVGIYSYPDTSYLVERYYWLTQNKGRLLETEAFTSSIVISECYAFRKGLIDRFPDDVVADDIYICYRTNNLGYKVSYIDRAYAKELRSPQEIKGFLRHKFRKANAFMRESLRFLYKTSEMTPIWKVIFLTKVAQLVLIPWLFSLYIVLGVSLISLYRWDVFLIGSFLLVLLLFITNRIFSLVSVIEEEKSKYPLSVIIKTFLASNFILFANGVSFIFFRQDSSYKKINVS
jgi:cellulose synthase/poly-beta-1,6-N-acetylglucosamine synthase-like glycosyltransferase